MRREFIDIMRCKTRYKAFKLCTWANKIAKCYMGWMAFESLEDYDDFKIEMKQK